MNLQPTRLERLNHAVQSFSHNPLAITDDADIVDVNVVARTATLRRDSQDQRTATVPQELNARGGLTSGALVDVLGEEERPRASHRQAAGQRIDEGVGRDGLTPDLGDSDVAGANPG